ncbi:MAG: hypothetical protein EBS05_24245 [Proteobacteria bacterium]|nr:hypothetical protein [Pseudomonadota bacterium]
MITVTGVNDAPTITLSTNQVMVLEDSGAFSSQSFATFGVGPANEIGQTITNVTVLSVTNSALFSVSPVISTSGVLTFTPAANANGSALVTFAVQDNGGTANGGMDKTTNSFVITVTAVNDAPTITLSTNLVVVLEDSGAFTSQSFVTFGVGPANESGQTITNVTVLSVTNGALFSVAPVISTSGSLTFTPAVNANGSALVTFAVQDSGGTANGGVDKATNTFVITVTAVNDAPTITLSTNLVVVLEDSGLYSNAVFATLGVGPANESGQTITNVTVLSVTNGALFSVAPVISTSGSLTFTPAANANGSALVTFAAQDNGGTANGGVDKATNSFVITVTGVNDAPTITLSTNLVVVLEDSGLHSNAVFATFGVGPANESAQAITNVAVLSVTNGSLFSVAPVISTSGALTFTPAANANGSALVTFAVQDSGGTANGGVDKATNSFVITVTGVNDAPTITLSTNLVVVLEDSGAFSSQS